MRAISIVAISFVAGVLGAPSMSIRAEDWKTELGWDGKSITPAQLDPSNAVKPTPGKPAPAALPGGVFLCTDNNWSGTCAFITNLNANQCYNVGNDFNDKTSSFGPDPGLACMLYSDFNCQGRSLGAYIVNPGFGNLAEANFNDVMSSFSCKNA